MEPTIYSKLYQIEGQYWWHRARREIIFTCFERFCDNKTKLHILDVGTGTGTNYRYLEKYGQVTGIDPSKEAVHFSKLRGCRDVRECSLLDTSFPSSSFDAIFALDVLEHLDDDYRALKEIERVLRPGGVAVITVPAFKFLWGRQDLYSYHRRRYTLYEIKKMTEQADLELKYISYFNFFLFPFIASIRYLQRLFKVPPALDFKLGNIFLNNILYQIMRSEKYLIAKQIKLPWGVSILCFLQKKLKEQKA
jgi:SAM-dependent methyltransferase